MSGAFCIDADYGEPIEMYNAKLVRARKAHRCGECDDTIAVGDLHEVVTGRCDGEWLSHRTCARCCNVRKDYFATCALGCMVEDFKAEHGVDYRKGIPAHITPCGARP